MSEKVEPVPANPPDPGNAPPEEWSAPLPVEDLAAIRRKLAREDDDDA